jgi:hypothetical protein
VKRRKCEACIQSTMSCSFFREFLILTPKLSWLVLILRTAQGVGSRRGKRRRSSSEGAEVVGPSRSSRSRSSKGPKMGSAPRAELVELDLDVVRVEEDDFSWVLKAGISSK